MLSVFLLVIGVLGVFQLNLDKLSSAIILSVGRPADIKEFPYQASLSRNNKTICGGVIISFKYIITAARCIAGITVNSLEVQVGSSYHDKEEDGYSYKRKVRQVCSHPQFDGNDYDIAIVTIRRGVKFTSHIRKINLPTEEEIIPAKIRATVSGWGTKNFSAANTSRLQAAEVSIVDLDECKKLMTRNVTDRMICASYDLSKKDTCLEDTGGPVAIGNKLIGIVSWGYDCAHPNKPGVYISVPMLRSFIYNVTRL